MPRKFASSRRQTQKTRILREFFCSLLTVAFVTSPMLTIAPTTVLTEEQERAMAVIDAFMVDPRRQVFQLHGLAGTGKTTLLQHVASQYRHAVVCSLTGKAASVIRRRFGLPACTLHSFFYRLIEANKGRTGGHLLRFARRHDDGELQGELALLDECSMIPDGIGWDLIATGAKIIACGDPGQLPPVKGAQFFSHADVTLTTIQRQALQSPIIRQVHRVRTGGTYAADGPKFRVASEGTDEDLRAADVVLCWTNRTTENLNRRCRLARGYWQERPQPGEPLLCLKNASVHGVYNGGVYVLLRPFLQGDTHIVLDVDGVMTTVPLVTFRGLPSALPEGIPPTTSFGFGYVLTVHKAQGSEWHSVVLFDEYRKTEQRQEWLYTAITRATDRILIVR